MPTVIQWLAVIGALVVVVVIWAVVEVLVERATAWIRTWGQR